MLCRIPVFNHSMYMHLVNRQAIVRHNAEKMFNLVNDIESYPQFLKWCHDSHLLEKTTDSMLAGMTISLAGMKKKFTTKNILSKNTDGFKIYLDLVKGPFEKLNGFWSFTSLDESASKIELHLEFNFKSGILNSAFKRAFGKIAQQLLSDFVKRAQHVYS